MSYMATLTLVSVVVVMALGVRFLSNISAKITSFSTFSTSLVPFLFAMTVLLGCSSIYTSKTKQPQKPSKSQTKQKSEAPTYQFSDFYRFEGVEKVNPYSSIHKYKVQHYRAGENGTLQGRERAVLIVETAIPQKEYFFADFHEVGSDFKYIDATRPLPCQGDCNELD